MAKSILNAYLQSSLVEKIEKMAFEKKVNKSQAVQIIVEAYFKETEDKK